MRLVRYAVILSALVAPILGAGRASAQAPTGVVTGRVTDSTARAPLAGARVAVVGSTRATVTRDDGTFIIAGVPEGTHRIRSTVIGYAASEQTVTVRSGQPSTANFVLHRTAVALSEVVVVGYGAQRRTDLTGSVASVPTEELLKNSAASVEQGLQGRVAGVQVTQGDAAPGGAISVQVRGISSTSGSNQPLYVIDGVPVGSDNLSKMQLGGTEPSFTTMTTTNPMSTIASSDIESIDVLKDASATAIYGSRGANGVVIITTKRGHSGKGQFNLSYNSGISQVVRQVDVLSAREYAEYANVATKNAGRTDCPYGCNTNATTPGASLTPQAIETLYGSGINWQDRIFHNAPTRDLQLGFTGGDDQGGFAVTSNYYDQQGAIIGSGFKRGGARINVDRQLTPIFHIQSNLAGTRSASRLVRTSGTEGTVAQGIVRSAIRYSPLPVEALDSARAGSDARAENVAYFNRFGANPTRYTDEVKETETETRALGSVRLGIKLPYNLNFESSVGGNYTSRENNSYFPRTVYEGYGNSGLAVVANPGYQNLVHEDLLRYQREFNANNRIDVVGGFTYEWDKSTWLRNQVANFPDDALGSNRLQNGLAVSPVNSDVSMNKLASWLGRVNYSLNDRYLLTGTLRTDGSSRFAANNKWATFSSVGLAWRVKQESFLKDVKAIDDLKLRGSLGQSGNQAIAPYQSLGTIEGATTVLNEQLVSAASIGRLGNPNLKWETTTQSDIGVDLALFGSRLTVTADVYNKATTGLLQSVNLAPNTGYGSATFNSGEVNNKGFELATDVQVLQGSPSSVQWSMSGTFSRNRNKIKDLGATLQQFSNRLGAGGGLEVNPFIQKPGLPIGAIWGYKTDGIFRSAAEVTAYSGVQADAKLGDYRYADTNGDGKLTDADRTVIGDVNPGYTWGYTNRLRWKQFDASALVTGSHGNSIINSARLNFLTLNGSNGNIPRTYYQNAFDPTSNPNGIYPMIRSDRSGAGRFSDAFVEDGSYIRLKNVQLGYELPANVVPGVQNARLFVNGINLLTNTDYTGFDPEVSAFSDVSMRGVDLGSYPQSRTFTLGLSVTF